VGRGDSECAAGARRCELTTLGAEMMGAPFQLSSRRRGFAKWHSRAHDTVPCKSRKDPEAG